MIPRAAKPVRPRDEFSDLTSWPLSYNLSFFEKVLSSNSRWMFFFLIKRVCFPIIIYCRLSFIPKILVRQLESFRTASVFELREIDSSFNTLVG